MTYGGVYCHRAVCATRGEETRVSGIGLCAALAVHGNGDGVLTSRESDILIVIATATPYSEEAKAVAGSFAIGIRSRSRLIVTLKLPARTISKYSTTHTRVGVRGVAVITTRYHRRPTIDGLEAIRSAILTIALQIRADRSTL